MRRAWEGFVALLGAALCRLGLHTPPDGQIVALSIYWECARCAELIDGGRAPKHKRRRKP